MGNRLNGFQPVSVFRDTWLKPGLNETACVDTMKQLSANGKLITKKPEQVANVGHDCRITTFRPHPSA
jgi:hypothetical protein